MRTWSTSRGTVQRGAALLAVALASIWVAAGCGGGDSAEEDNITAAITEAATSGDPARCTEVQTENFNQQTVGGSGGDPTAACEEDAANSVGDQVDVSNIEIDGDTATADAAVTGSTFDGQTLELALVKDGDQWKLDEFTGFADFDREALTDVFIADVSSDPQTPPSVAPCLEQKIQSFSDEDLQGFFLNSESSVGEQLFGPCFAKAGS